METKVLAVVGARLNSSRVPRKQLLKLAHSPMILHIINRLKQSRFITQIVVATTMDHYNDDLAFCLYEEGVDCFRYQGGINDVVGRINSCYESNNADILVYICGDCPLVDPHTVDRFIDELINKPADIATVKLLNAKPAIHEGIHVFKRQVWTYINEQSCSAYDREHVGSILHEKRHSFIESNTLLAPSHYGIKQRISVDTKADYDFMQLIYERWYEKNNQKSIVDFSWALEMIQQNPRVSQINQHVIQRSALTVSLSFLFVVQANEQVGLGHLVRSLRIATGVQEYLAAGVQLVVLGNPIPSADLKFVNHQFIESQEQLEALVVNAIKSLKVNVVVYDLPKRFCWLDPDKIAGLSIKSNILSVDVDCQHSPNIPDLFWVPSFLEPVHPKFLKKMKFGWDSFFFPKVLCGDLEPSDDVLILTGGSDAYKLGEILPEKIEAYQEGSLNISWIQGPLSPAPHIPSDTFHHWSVYMNPDDIYQKISQAKLIIAVYGMSALEALYLNGCLIVLDPAQCHVRELEVIGNLPNVYVEKEWENLCQTLSTALKYSQSTTNKKESLMDGCYEFSHYVSDLAQDKFNRK